MTVNSVNGNSNAGLCALGGAAVGAGAGAAAAYLTRPFLKDGAPTDEFIKKMDEKVSEAMPEDMKQVLQETQKIAKDSEKALNEAKTIQEIKNIFVNSSFKNIPEGVPESELVDTYKSIAKNVADNLKAAGIDVKTENIPELENITTIEGLKEFLGKIFDKEYAGKSVDEIKELMNAENLKLQRQSGKAMFETFWDSSSKKFINCEEGVGSAVKKAARSIQGKFALIYGGIAAAVLGLGTYLVAHKKPADTDRVDIKA